MLVLGKLAQFHDSPYRPDALYTDLELKDFQILDMSIALRTTEHLKCIWTNYHIRSEESMNKKLNIGRVVTIGGAFIAFAIGSGFSTGQEIMQFFAAYGTEIVLCAVVFFIGNLYMNYNFLEAGRKGQFEKGSQVFNYFGGKYIGLFFDWFSVIFSFASYFVMMLAQELPCSSSLVFSLLLAL